MDHTFVCCAAAALVLWFYDKVAYKIGGKNRKKNYCECWNYWCAMNIYILTKKQTADERFDHKDKKDSSVKS